MDFTLKHQPSYSLLHVTLKPGEQIKAEAGAMVYMQPDLQVETRFGSGILSAVARKFLGGESLFMNYFTAGIREGYIGLAANLAGDIMHRQMQGESFYVQSGAFLCSDPKLEIKPQFGGLKTFFGGEGLFLLKVSGTGDLFCSSYGAIIPIDVDGAYIVDTGHIVAFEESLAFSVKKVGNWKSTFFSGEGLVCEFSGKGKVWIQSRVPSGFIGWLTKLLPH
jgi:uncharacterized protein (TIGR00266 family)